MNIQIIKRTFVILITSLAILTTAQSCSGLNLGLSNPLNSSSILGVLKHDPEVKADGFGQVNSVKTISGGKDAQGLTNLSGNKLIQTSKDNLYLLTKTKGLFKTTNGGRDWERKYVFSISSDEKDDKKKTQDITDKISKNDSFVPSDFSVDTKNDANLYISGKTNDKIGKIFSSSDGGDTFKLIYTEVQADIGVIFTAIDPVNPLRVYGILEGGSLIRSMDGGGTWSKIQNFKEQPVQIGFQQNGSSSIFYLIFHTLGIAFSKDDGLNWNFVSISKEVVSDKPGEKNQNESGLFNTSNSKDKFTLFDKIIPVSSNQDSIQACILIADNQLWYSEDLAKGTFKKLILPLQADQQNILDVTFDQSKGLNRILVSVGNRLLETKNRGDSWNAQDNIGLNSKIGNIGQIVIDKDSTEVVYLMMIDSKYKRVNGKFE